MNAEEEEEEINTFSAKVQVHPYLVQCQSTSMFLDKHSINKLVQKISGKYLYSLCFFFTAENP
jgi:hypothetical protein